jgi:hypothetical protein
MASQYNNSVHSPGKNGAGLPTRMSGFIGRHRLLSSFLCLMIAPILTDCFIIYKETARHKDWLTSLMYAASLKLGCVIPIFLISLRLSSYLRRQEAVYPDTFAERFVTSASASFVTFTISTMLVIPILFFLLLGGSWQFFSNRSGLIELVVVTLNAFVYGILFGLFFGSATRVSMGSIIYQSSIITFLILLWYAFLHLVTHIHM